jgi:hypothetical protein
MTEAFAFADDFPATSEIVDYSPRIRIIRKGGRMEHGPTAAKAFVALIKQTAPSDGKPGRNRSLVIGATPKQPVILVSSKPPNNALAELKTMSKSLGAVTPVAIGQVILEEGEVHVKVLKPASETAARKAFADYFKLYKVVPPSAKVKLWQPDQWEAVEFAEDPHDGGADAPAAPEVQPEQPDQSAPDASPQQPTARPDLRTLSSELGSLIRHIQDAGGASSPATEPLKKLANAAAAAIKGNDQAGAADIIARLRDGLRTAVAGAAAGAASGRGEGAGEATSAVEQPSGKQLSGDDLLATFRDAKDEVDVGLNKLQVALRETEDPDMIRIAEFGLYGLAGEGGQGVGLMKALLGLRAAAPDERESLMKAARDAATAYKTAVLGDGVLVDLVDKNPFNVTVEIRSKLLAALDIIANAA